MFDDLYGWVKKAISGGGRVLYVTSGDEYNYNWPGIYFHGEAEKLFWPGGPKALLAPPDRVSCDVSSYDLKAGIRAVKIDHMGEFGRIETKKARAYIWQPEKGGLKGLIVLLDDDKSLAHASNMFTDEVGRI